MHIAFILKGYPRISETFIAQEILALEKRGFKIDIFSLRSPREKFTHQLNKKINADIHYLPEYIYLSPLKIFLSWLKIKKLPGYKASKKEWLNDLKKDFSPNRIRRFAQAIVLSKEIPNTITHLHAHFLHTPTSVAYYASKILQKPYSISAHAKDIWTIKDWEKKKKLEGALWVTTCTEQNFTHLSNISPSTNINLVYHGIDFNLFPIRKILEKNNKYLERESPVIILSVGRLVEKKGFDILLKSLSLLPKELNWKLEHIGNGPLNYKIKKLADKLNLSNKINWNGTLTQDKILNFYKESDIFVLACKVTQSGDRDGIPNVLLEAQSQGLACISTSLPSIEELIINNISGILVKSGSVSELKEAIIELIKNPNKRKNLAAEGQKRVKEKFSMNYGIEKITKLLLR
ncbi:MAG: GDP-mannose-dependent alpha-(1-6)-phosphatidylinositol monomannoside mannosyltransferase [Alphaproteobacteria bacterium MarineAlpha2_Bin1]|nr:MAG: GDP-mannose-dependent alpha-(1-6)-phosphatidylinositol monomannoside mannosyltransferase [Alphaproteobacteria bacterium MarineAlpha2_Bin1]